MRLTKRTAKVPHCRNLVFFYFTEIKCTVIVVVRSGSSGCFNFDSTGYFVAVAPVGIDGIYLEKKEKILLRCT